MQGLDWTPLREPIALPCTKTLDFATRNVLAGVLNAAEGQKANRTLRSLSDVRFDYGGIRVHCPEWIDMGQMLTQFRKLEAAGLVVAEGWRFRLDQMLVLEYAEYKVRQTQIVE